MSVATLLHHVAPFFLDLLAEVTPEVNIVSDPLEWRPRGRNIYFKNRFGIAGGLDKNAQHIASWRHFGCGFAEVGTITPLPQGPNPGKIVDRYQSATALWNKMGFPNLGGRYAAQELIEFRHNYDSHKTHFPIFANIGKNRFTENQNASSDYLELISEFTKVPGLVDAFVINISSPNTKGLRDLLEPKNLKAFLGPIADKCSHTETPWLLKLSPDLEEDSIRAILDTLLALKADGVIATNTTASRRPEDQFPIEGGISGEPLREKSRLILKKMISHLGGNREDFLVVSAGGILDASEFAIRRQIGADLCQAYAGFVFRGPYFVKKVHGF